MASDSMLMPPPPPRLPKRQKIDIVAAALVDEPSHPDSISIPPPPSVQSGGGGRDDEYFGDGNSSGGDDRARSISPDELGGGGNIDASDLPMGSESSVVRVAKNQFETEKRIQSRVEPSFDCIDNENNDAMEHENDFQYAQSEDVPSQNNYESHTTNHDDAQNEISTITESSRGGQQGSKKKKQSRECDSPPPINVSFRDIIGHGQAKLRLDEALLPLALPPDLADSVLTGIRAAPASILLHGPPGCGKTKLAKAVAGEAQAAFLSVGPSDILSKFVGESEASIRGLFREARRKAKKMESKCAVIFFDEIDALGRSRVDEESGKMSQAGGDNSSRRLLAELLIQMTALAHDNGEGESGSEAEGEECDDYCDDGDSFTGRSTISTGIEVVNQNDDMPLPVSLGPRPLSPISSSNQSETKSQCEEQQSGTPIRECNNRYNDDKMQPKPRVIVVAATNRPEDCDPALLRRFAVRVLVGLPSRKDRKKIIRRLLSDVQHNISSSQLDALALATEGWSGSDLESMTREAVMAPVRECLREAAILKKKASKSMQRGGVGSSQMSEQNRADDAHSATRESLLNSFRNLRLVSSKDFEDGIVFFLGRSQDDSAFGHLGNSDKHAHYDSSSSSEDEGF
ncbi:hypothetical protein ACHAXR_010470 [Thalassiosira sp. AJA248-18]